MKNEDLKALLPCPFCSAENSIHQIEINDFQWYQLTCKRCAVTTGASGTKALVIERWNARPTVTPTDTAMEDAVTREDTGLGTRSDRQATSSTTDGAAERCLDILQAGGLDEGERYRLFKFVRTALQSTRKPPDPSPHCNVHHQDLFRRGHAPIQWVCLDCEKEAHVYLKSQTLTPPIPADTIPVPREVLQGVKKALNNAYMAPMLGEKCGYISKALATLDAVLSEGE